MEKLEPRSLLLSPQLEPDQVAAILSPYGFKEIPIADTNLQSIADEPRSRHLLSDIIEELLRAFSQSADPDQALNYFERFIKASYHKNNVLSYLKDSPYTLGLLAKLLSSSPFLSEILIRNPTYLYWIADSSVLDQEKSPLSLAREFSSSLRNLRKKEKKLEALCILKRKELLRIGVRDLLKKTSVKNTTAELSALAGTIVQKVYEICCDTIQSHYGLTLQYNKKGKQKKPRFTILGMGKLGGGELNFSSDVDLIYLYEIGEGTVSNKNSKGKPEVISLPEYFRKLSQEITSALSGFTNEGHLYRVDLRLRPEGQSGHIANSLDAHLHYYATQGETWERLALLKAWPIAGDLSLGRLFIKKVFPFIYGTPFSTQHLEEVKILKDKIDRKIKMKGETHFHVKLGKGGIREIEFIVQSLQIFFSSTVPNIYHRNTLSILKILKEKKILTTGIFQHLKDAYIFLRKVENSLQMVHESQTHLIPENPSELRICALRLDYRDQGSFSASQKFLKDYGCHTQEVHQIFLDLFEKPLSSSLLLGAINRTHHPSSKQPSKKV